MNSNATATPSAPSETVDALVNALRSRGLRISASRRMILQILRDAAGALSAREICEGPEGGSIGLDLASVYRNLEILEEHHLVTRIHAGDGPGRYVLGGKEHEYLACAECGAVLEVHSSELDELRALIRQRYGYEVAFSRVPIVGSCSACR